MLSCEMSILGRVFAIFFIIHQAAAPFPFNDFDNWLVPLASAVLYSPNTKVPQTGEVALRKSIPENTAMKSIQDLLEDIYYLLRFPQRKPYGTMEGDVKSALQIATNEKDSILGSVPLDMKERGVQLYNFLIDGQGGLQVLIESIKEKDPDKVSMNLSSSLDSIAQLELLQAPGLPYLLPEQYQQNPRLNGRATVMFTMEKGDNSMFSVSSGGGNRRTKLSHNIIFVAAEVAPYSKTGGLGDVCGSLPIALTARGHRMMVISPRYMNGVTDKKNSGAFDVQCRIKITSFGGEHQVAFFMSTGQALIGYLLTILRITGLAIHMVIILALLAIVPLHSSVP